MNKNRKTKKETLKRKSRSKHLMSELSYMTLPEAPLLEIEENQLFCQKVFTFLQSREHKIQIHGDNYLEHIEKSTQVLKEMAERVKETPKQGRLLFSESMKLKRF
ncbi:YxiF family protein [Bacillus xiamenensis]|uniref:YxiF family protein n=1 Tax=Bacillus xiamenensis TaxID=1178537 RepID=UPI000AFFFD4A|nr:hypothetical protein [Bacillus xiamenensis]